MPPSPATLRLVRETGPESDRGASEVAPTFDALFDRYHAHVATLAHRLLGGSSEVDDVVQDVFYLCWQRLHKLTDIERARGWLSTVTVRVVRRRLRRARLRRFFHLPLEEGRHDAAWQGVSSDDRVLLKRVYAALENVPVDHRLAWSLRYVEGTRLEAVAEACGCSLATAKRWITSTQERLEKELGDD